MRAAHVTVPGEHLETRHWKEYSHFAKEELSFQNGICINTLCGRMARIEVAATVSALAFVRSVPAPARVQARDGPRIKL